MSFRHNFCKVYQSFLAMLVGWVACNVAIWLYNLPQYTSDRFSGLTLRSNLIVMAICSGIVVFVAWLLIFLPTHLLVPNSSHLRRPGKSAGCGAIVGFLIMYIFWLVFAIFEQGTFGFKDLLAPVFSNESRLFLIASTLTGLAASFTLSQFDNHN